MKIRPPLRWPLDPPLVYTVYTLSVHIYYIVVILFRVIGQGVFDPEKRRQTNGVQKQDLRDQPLRGSMYGCIQHML